MTEKEQLIELARGIVLAQGNVFIKELLKKHKVKIGTTKAEFLRNMLNAIDSGDLTKDHFDEWLLDVEGWGNQHVYLFMLSPALCRTMAESRLHQKAIDAGYGQLWNASTIMEFPDEPKLTSISFTDGLLHVIWQEGTSGWKPEPEKNYKDAEGLDTYEFRAYRRIQQRAVTRFVADPNLGLAALFIGHPIQGQEHEEALKEAMTVLGKLFDVAAMQQNQIDMKHVSRNMDQNNLPVDGTEHPSIRTHKSRLASGGSYVEFAATSKEKSYAEEDAIRDVRNSIRTEHLQDFQGAAGEFIFQAGCGSPPLKRPLRVNLYGRDNRIRLWAQMESSEVWSILEKISSYWTGQ